MHTREREERLVWVSSRGVSICYAAFLQRPKLEIESLSQKSKDALLAIEAFSSRSASFPFPFFFSFSFSFLLFKFVLALRLPLQQKVLLFSFHSFFFVFFKQPRCLYNVRCTKRARPWLQYQKER